MDHTLRIPVSTYRIQFSRDFTFRRAREIVPYLHSLGVTDFYSSPFFKAGSDSPHGYDISDHNELNPAIGSREDFDAFAEELKRHGMGQIVDFVPNHMGIEPSTNPWWRDVLENGPSSPYAQFFDIDWRPLKEELDNKVLIPVLEAQYGQVLEKGGFQLSLRQGSFVLSYYEHEFPIAPCSYGMILKPAIEMLSPYYEEEVVDELQSILSAIENLPARTETDPERVQVRIREKEVIKRRLDRLCADCPQVLEGIEQAIHTIQGTPGDPRSFDAFHELLDAQAYRLSYWRVAADEINYRRFFDINDLAAIRMEVPDVFNRAHRLVFRMIGEGKVTGLRVDHPDGLWNPREYFEKLQERAAEISGEAVEAGTLPLYLVVEKILSGEEKLPSDWQVHGTTGYDFTNDTIGLLVDASAERALTGIYSKFIDGRIRFNDLVYDRKRLVMRLSLASEINVLGHILNGLSERNRWYRDFTLNSLIAAVGETIACFPIYRTYLAPGQPVRIEDQQAILRAIARAKRRNPGVEASVFDFLRDNLLFQFPANIDKATAEEHFAFVMKFQQSTGPIMAKGLEDTAFYYYNRLVALNEVGGEPDRFGVSAAEFHERNLWRQRKWPHTMLATSTHDTKRGEDVRARIAAISEIPAEWSEAVGKWSRENARWKTRLDGEIAPDENEEYLLYQTLAGAWPLHAIDDKEHGDFLLRIQNYMTKAIKEAKVNTSWIQPYEEWDQAVREFVAAILDREKNASFFEAFAPVQERIAELGAVNSLSQAVLKLTVPGVPDIYQGNEIWDFSLVDPDNRRPVDFEHRARLLESLEGTDPAELMAGWRDGRIKLFMTAVLLRFRRDHPELFACGDYVPLSLKGTFKERAVAFARHAGKEAILVAVPRLSGAVGFPPTGDRWKDTVLDASSIEGSSGMRCLFTGTALPKPTTGRLPLPSLFETLPFAVYVA